MPHTAALLYQSFGGPESFDEVLPFLYRVAVGKKIPEERLFEVAQHYYACGGFSPLNRDNRQIISHIEKKLAERKFPMQVYFGNRNSAPFVIEALQSILKDGHKKVYAFRTSAWGGYSGRTQYEEDLLQAAHELGTVDMQIFFSSEFYQHPHFVHGYASATSDALEQLQNGGYPHSDIAVIFTAHSVPIDSHSGYELYQQQVVAASKKVATSIGVSDYQIAWQSRSGLSSVPWLEPSIEDTINRVHRIGYRGVCVVPIGFISDHIEVLWDIDHEAYTLAQSLNLAFVRAATIGLKDNFAELVVDLVDKDFYKA